MTATWHTQARCHDQPGDFHGTNSRNAAKQCPQCPCNEVCFWTAMVDEEEHAAADTSQFGPMRYGVWGGATPARRAMLAGLYGPPNGERMRLLRSRLDRALFDHDDRQAHARLRRKAAGS